MVDGGIILQIFFITLGMFSVGLLFNHFFGLNREEMSKLQEKARNLQERMKNAQLMGDPQMMQQIQSESMELTKDMMKKQMVPLCVRCVIFLGIFALLGLIYAPYDTGILPFKVPLFGDGWVAIYILFSLSFSLIYFVSKYIYRKISGKQKTSLTGGMMQMLSPHQDANSEIMDYSAAFRPENERSKNISTNKKEESEEIKKKDSWKDKLDS
ncbi:MAG: DUF106 domain-containing protein [Promethearchaeota archaeon]|nr:MAG: DUF106 domain-containing protein [Candidatus Lokiarchaeota archaeon]